VVVQAALIQDRNVSWPWDQVLLARHGQTEWNVLRRRQGQLDSPLTSMGVAQAGRCAELLRSFGVDAIFTSPLQRCVRTASIIGEDLGVGVIVIPQFAEVHHGDCAGLTEEEIHHRYPKEWARRASDRYHWTFPAGESYADADRRAFDALERLRAHPSDRPLIVSHEMIGKLIQRHLFGLDVDEAMAIRHPQDIVHALAPGLRTRVSISSTTT
jgi:broad specificity phosphatase PhoE